MDSNIVAQQTTGTTASTDNYSPIEPRAQWTATQTSGRTVIPITCTIKNFYISYATAAGGGLTRTFTLQKNGVDTAITTTITDPATSGNDTTHQVTFAPGDTAALHTTASGTTANTGVTKWTLGVSAASNTSLVTGGAITTPPPNASTTYISIQGNTGANATAANVEQVMPTAGTFRNAYLVWNTTVGASPKQYTVTLYKNGSPSAITFVTSNTSGSDTTHTVSVAAGDRFYWEFVPANTPTARIPAISMEFNPTTNGESVRMSAVNTTPSTSVANFISMSGTDTTYAGSDAARSGLTQACVFKKMYVYLAVAPGGTVPQYNMQTVVNGAAGNPSVSVVGAAQTGNDTTNTVSATVGQTASFKITPAVTPAATNAEISVVSYIAVPALSPGSLTSMGVGI